MKKIIFTIIIISTIIGINLVYANNRSIWSSMVNNSCRDFENKLASFANLNKSIRTLGMCRIRCHNVFGSSTEKSECWRKCTDCY